MCNNSVETTYRKRAVAKWLTSTHLYNLIALNSEKQKSYYGSLLCSSRLYQEPGKIVSHYCNQRWCLVCARIRTAKFIQEYGPVLAEFSEPYFVTLTEGSKDTKPRNFTELVERLNSYHKTSVKIKRAFRGGKLKGIRKLEVTYSTTKRWYHPHYHYIVDGKEVAEKIVQIWQSVYGKKRAKQCKSEPARAGFEKELGKYITKFTKTVWRNGKKTYLPIPSLNLDTIFRALSGRRTIQPIGIRKVPLEEEMLEDLQAEEFDEIMDYAVYTWNYRLGTWLTDDGEPIVWAKEHIDKRLEALPYTMNELVFAEKMAHKIGYENGYQSMNNNR